MIKFVLNHIPRPVLQRAAKLAMPLASFWYAVGHGKNGGVECPLCGARYRRFMPYGYVWVRKNALCPNCLSLERHRLLWLWLTRETGLLHDATDDLSVGRSGCGRRNGGCYKAGGVARSASRPHPLERELPKFLHIAPEACLAKKFEKIYKGPQIDRYITADLESPLAKVRLDVQQIPFPDETFDVIFCNHVLEHVPDDRLAMREMYRVMRTGGWGVMLSPVDESRAATFEDDSVIDPAERTRIFGQYDHHRIYGRDYATRLHYAGWKVEKIDYLATLTLDERERYALRREILYVVKK